MHQRVCSSDSVQKKETNEKLSKELYFLNSIQDLESENQSFEKQRSLKLEKQKSRPSEIQILDWQKKSRPSEIQIGLAKERPSIRNFSAKFEIDKQKHIQMEKQKHIQMEKQKHIQMEKQ